MNGCLPLNRTYEEGYEEDCAYNPGCNRNFLYLAGEEPYEYKRDYTHTDTLGYRIAEQHYHEGHERNDCVGRVAPVYLDYRAHHEYAYPDESRSRGAAGNELGYGREEHCDYEAQTGYECGEARFAARSHARGRFDECGYGGSARDCARAGCDCVGKHHLFHAYGSAVFIQQVALGACAVQRAYRIEHIYHAEGDGRNYENDYERARAVALGAEVMREIEALVEYDADGIFAPGGERVEGIFYVDVCEHSRSRRNVCAVSYAGEHVVEHGRAQKTPQYRAFNVLFRENGDCDYADQSNDCGKHAADRAGRVGHKFARAEHVEGDEARQSAVVIYDNARLLHADECDEQTYADGHRMAHRGGNGLENLFAQTRYRKEQENNAVQKHEHHGVCIGETGRRVEQGINYERVDAHARSLCERHFCKERHEQGAHDCADCSGYVSRAVGVVAAYNALEHSRVDHENVDHCHERGEAGNDFGAVVGAASGYAEPVVDLGPEALFLRLRGAGAAVCLCIFGLLNVFVLPDFFSHTKPPYKLIARKNGIFTPISQCMHIY